MNETCNLRAQMTIDFRKMRIRLNKDSLHLLGDPKYIQLLVNINKHLIAIRAVDETQVDLQSYKINHIDSEFPLEIYSSKLFTRLYSEFKCFNKEYSYHLPGKAQQSEGIIFFDIDSLQKNEIHEYRL